LYSEISRLGDNFNIYTLPQTYIIIH